MTLCETVLSIQSLYVAILDRVKGCVSHENMAVESVKLVAALKRKREAGGLSIRGLSSIIGVSFSSLARIERGEGEPDNNSLIRILEWLGEDGRESGLSFQNVALVHFRASKNVKSKTVHCLMQAADTLKRAYSEGKADSNILSEAGSPTFSSSEAIPLSKPEMESMATDFRQDLGLGDADRLEAMNIRIDGVDVMTPSQVSSLSKNCLSHLIGNGSDSWSAMSVPLDPDLGKWIVLRNDQHTPERQRVTYLEECWHIMLDHKLTKIAKISDTYGRTYDSNEEHDAYYLAAASLLPEEAITNLVKAKKTAAEIADIFGASPALVEYRIKRLGLWRNYKGIPVKLDPNQDGT